MGTYIALLRGINVSGKNMIKMPELVVQFQSLGYKKVRTYIQSGNIIFESSEKKIETIENKIHVKILKSLGFDVPVLVKSADDLKQVYENNPFIKSGNADIDKLHVTFLNGIPNNEHIAKLDNFKNLEDQFIVKDSSVYICCENGYGKTKLNNTFFENKLKVSATTRNWKTVGKLVEMVENN